MTNLETPDYLVLGHVTKDNIPDGAILGGTPSYAGLTAHKLGVTFYRSRQPRGLDSLVVGDRRHGQHHSGTQRSRHQLQGTETGVSTVQMGALVSLECALPGGDAHPVVPDVSGRHLVHQCQIVHVTHLASAHAHAKNLAYLVGQ